MHKPHVFCIKFIKYQGKTVGYIHLVKYNYGKDAVPHIEYAVDAEYQNKGLLQAHLSKYLKEMKKNEKTSLALGFGPGDKLIAVAAKGNTASIHILEKFNFVFVKEVEGYCTFVYSSKFSMKQISDAVNSFKSAQEWNKETEEYFERIRKGIL